MRTAGEGFFRRSLTGIATDFLQPFIVLLMQSAIALCSLEGQYVTLSLHKFQTQPAFEVARTTSQASCTARCTINPLCRAISFSATLGLCELYPQNLTVSTLTVDETWNSLIKVSTSEMTGLLQNDHVSIAGAMIVSGQADATYPNYTLESVVSNRQCRSMCGMLLAWSCYVFSYNSETLQCVMFAIDFYNTWTSLVRGSSWTSFYRRDTSRQKLLYKATKATLVNVAGTFSNTGRSNATSMSSDMAIGSALESYKYLKSDILESWSLFPLENITIKLASTAGAILKFVSLNVTNTTINTFFDQNNILDSSWSDLPGYSGTPGVNMTIGLTNTYKGRYFQIQTLKDCANDKSWIHVNGLATGECPFDKAPVPYPQFLYSSLTTLDFSKNYAAADNFLIYASL